MDTTNVVDLEHLRDISRKQREIAAAMCAEAKLMTERAGRMLTVVTTMRSMLARERPHVAVSLPPAAPRLASRVA